MRREPGLGGKRHMTTGVLQRPAPGPRQSLGGRHAVIVGGALAGAGVAQGLALRGWRVTVLDAHARQRAIVPHEGHLAAALTPVMARDDDIRARLVRAGSLRAQARWCNLPIAAVLRCGTLQLVRDDSCAAATAQAVAALRLPADWLRTVDKNEACDLAGVPVARPGLYWAAGMLVRPLRLIEGLLQTPGVTRLTQTAARLTPFNGGWQVLDAAGQVLVSADVVVVANGTGAPALLHASGLLSLPRLATMHKLTGEITLLPATALNGGPRCIVSGAGYLLPNVEGWCVAGSTYLHGAQACAVTVAGQEVNLKKVEALLGSAYAGLAVMQAGTLPGWAGWRAVLAGRLPVVGELPYAPGVWLATAYASRGLSWSALAGDLIGARLGGEPEPVESDLTAAIAPR